MREFGANSILLITNFDPAAVTEAVHSPSQHSSTSERPTGHEAIRLPMDLQAGIHQVVKISVACGSRVEPCLLSYVGRPAAEKWFPNATGGCIASEREHTIHGNVPAPTNRTPERELATLPLPQLSACC